MTERSAELYAAAVGALPGGNSRTTLFVAPHPPYARRGEGCWVEDEDGHRVIDLQNNYTALIHGHAHPAVTAAAVAALHDGGSFGLPTGTRSRSPGSSPPGCRPASAGASPTRAPRR